MPGRASAAKTVAEERRLDQRTQPKSLCLGGIEDVFDDNAIGRRGLSGECVAKEVLGKPVAWKAAWSPLSTRHAGRLGVCVLREVEGQHKRFSACVLDFHTAL